MTGIFDVLLIFILIIIILRVSFLLIKRLSLYFRLKRLGRIEGVTVRVHRNPILALLFIGESPDYSVKVDNTVYYVRAYNGAGAGKVVHFASRDFTVRFTRLVTASHSSVRGGKRLHGFSRGVSIGSKVIILPPLAIPDSHPEGCAVREVFIFNPAPGEVSYVTEERTRIEVAFTGDEIHGRKIFTASTFETYIDRESRSAFAPQKDVYVFDDIYK